MAIKATRCMSFEEYKRRVDFYTRTSPFELSYQRTIESLLESILDGSDVEVIVSDRFARKGTQSHPVSAYKQPGTASPDLILAENFSYLNPAHAKYLAFVEVKKPNHIKYDAHKKAIVLNSHDSNQLTHYLEHENIHKLIFTDCYIWAFYFKAANQSEELKPTKIFNLTDEPECWPDLYSYIKKFFYTTDKEYMP